MQDKVNQFFRTIPAAKAVLLAVVFLLSAAFAGGCWWLKASAEKDAAMADDKLKAQQTLALPYARLLERQRSLTALVKRTPSKPMPAAITDLNQVLAEVAKEAGLPGARTASRWWGARRCALPSQPKEAPKTSDGSFWC